MGQSNKFGTVIVSVPRRLVNARSNTYLFIHGGSKMSRAIHIRKIITFLVIMTFFLTACSADSLVEIENKDVQFQEVNKQLKDLKQIKVKGLDDDQMEKMFIKIISVVERTQNIKKKKVLTQRVRLCTNQTICISYWNGESMVFIFTVIFLERIISTKEQTIR